jgi:hypothetical protein
VEDSAVAVNWLPPGFQVYGGQAYCTTFLGYLAEFLITNILEILMAIVGPFVIKELLDENIEYVPLRDLMEQSGYEGSSWLDSPPVFTRERQPYEPGNRTRIPILLSPDAVDHYKNIGQRVSTVSPAA